MNKDFPEVGWTEKLVGVLQDDGSLSFAQYPKLRVQLSVETGYGYPAAGKPGSWHPQEGCVIASWPSGSQIEFSMFRNRGTWESPFIYNRKTSSGANFPVHCIEVIGWEETFDEHCIAHRTV